MYVGINKKASKVASVFINLSSSSGLQKLAQGLTSSLSASEFVELEEQNNRWLQFSIAEFNIAE